VCADGLENSRFAWKTTAALESAARKAMSENWDGATWFVFTRANFAGIVSGRKF